jgi:PAS domain S-box-containing protein
MARRLAEKLLDGPSKLAIDLDPQEIECKKAQRTYYLNVIQFPILRILGFLLIIIYILLNNVFLLKQFSWIDFSSITVFLLLYSLISWLTLYIFFERVKFFDLGICFLVFDIFIWAFTIYFTGGEKSLLFVLMIVRAADQSAITFKRVLIFAHISILSYVLMLLYLNYIEHKQISLLGELPKLIFIYAINIYFSLTTKTGEQYRNRTADAVRVARELILQLEEKSKQLEASKSDIERLSRHNELILSSAGEGIYGLDVQGNVTFINPATMGMTGYSAAELLGRPMHAMLHHSKPDGTAYPWEASAVFATLSTGTIHRVSDDVMWRKDGTNFPVEFVSTPIRAHGEIVGAVVTFNDITARKRTEEALQKAKEGLELKVEERTFELQQLNKQLRTDIAKRQQAEAMFRGLLESAPDAMVIVNSDDCIVLINAQTEKLFGYGRHELIGKPLELLVPARACGDSRRPHLGSSDLGASPAGSGSEYCGRRKDGTEVPIDISLSPVTTQAGVLAVYAMRDITERQRAEGALAAEARFLRAQTAVAKVALSSLRPEDLGGPLLETTGRTQGYACGTLWRVAKDGKTATMVASFGDGTAAFIGMVQDLSETSDFLARIIRTGEPAFINRIPETPYRVHPIARVLKTQALLGLPLVARTDQVVGAIVFIDTDNGERFTERDLTQGAVLASQVAQALENSELFSQVNQLQEQYRVVTEALNDAVFTLDAQGQFAFGNAAGERLTGYRLEELLGYPFANLVAPEDLPGLVDRFQRAIAGESISPHVEVEMIRKDGRHVPVELSMANLILDGRIAGRVGVARDITERRRVDAQIKASLQEKEVLLKEIHHRVKNNLQIISSLLNLQSKYIKDPRTLQMFNDSQNRIKSMASIHEILYQSRDIARIDFSEYIRNLMVQLIRSYGDHSKAIEFEINVKNIMLDVDTAISCGLIINELVSNSLKYAFSDKRSGKIHIEMSESTDNVLTLIVHDDGVNFPKEIELGAMDSLGLKLVLALTNRLSGRVELDTTNGTMFKIIFNDYKYRERKYDDGTRTDHDC